MPELQKSQKPLCHVVGQVSKASLDSDYRELDPAFHGRINKEFVAIFNIPHLKQ